MRNRTQRRPHLLLFGGDVANPAATEYVWNGVAWRPLVTPVPRRTGHAMAVDPSTGGLVLFGGGNTGGALFDTWTFDGATWSQVVTSNAPPSSCGCRGRASIR